jgi:hypothetical protein
MGHPSFGTSRDGRELAEPETQDCARGGVGPTLVGGGELSGVDEEGCGGEDECRDDDLHGDLQVSVALDEGVDVAVNLFQGHAFASGHLSIFVEVLDGAQPHRHR